MEGWGGSLTCEKGRPAIRAEIKESNSKLVCRVGSMVCVILYGSSREPVKYSRDRLRESCNATP